MCCDMCRGFASSYVFPPFVFGIGEGEMEQIVIKAYTYNELSDDAKEKAREWYKKDGNYIDAYMITEDMKQTLEDAGLADFDVLWSLSYCQGDGVAIDGRVNVEAFIKSQRFLAKEVPGYKGKTKERYATLLIGSETVDKMQKLVDNGVQLDITIKHVGRYSHANSMSVSVEHDSDEMAPEVDQNIREAFEGYVKQVCRTLERDGYAWIEWQGSDECVKETLLAHGWLFTAEGSRTVVL